MPSVISGVADQNGAAPKMIPQIADGIGGYPVHQRTTADSFRNEAIVAAVEATGRKTLLISGVSSEVAVQLPALTAADMGYRVFVVVDACGGMSERTEQAAIQRISKAGVAIVSVMTLAGELAEISARRKLGGNQGSSTKWPWRNASDAHTVSADSSATALVTNADSSRPAIGAIQLVQRIADTNAKGRRVSLPQAYKSVKIGVNVAPRAVSTYAGRTFDTDVLSRATNPDCCKSLSRSARTLSLRPGRSCRSRRNDRDAR